MVCGVNEIQPPIYVLTPLSIHQCVHGWGWFAIAQATRASGSYPYWPHNTPTIVQHGWTKTGTCLLLPGVVCDISWDPSNKSCIDTPLNSSVGILVRLIQNCTCNRARWSYPYWPHNTPRMDQHEWNETGTLLALALVGVWCTMNYNHPYRFWHPT